MQAKFNAIFEQVKAEYQQAEIIIELVGDRPAMGNFDKTELDKYANMVVDIQHRCSGLDVKITSGSTDCNIPLSLGIPSVAIGVRNGGGVHTREEFLEIDSLPLGFELAINVMKEFLK